MSVPVQDSSPDLRAYLSILRARKWTVIGVTAVCVAAALAMSIRQTPVYVSRARVLVSPSASVKASYFPNLKTESQLIRSNPIAERVRDDIGWRGSVAKLLAGLRVDQVVNTEVLLVSYSSPDAGLSKAAANSFARSYIAHRSEQAEDALDSERRSAQKPVDEVTAKLAEVRRALNEARAKPGPRVTQLETELSTLAARLGVLQQRLADLERDATTIGGGQIIEPAVRAAAPSSPNHERTGALGGVLGLMLGAGAALVRERLADRFRSRPEVESAIQVPVLGSVPRFQRGARAYEPILLADPWCPASEAYRSLRTSLQYLCSQHGIRSILVTSPGEGDGKTVTTANVGIALAQTGRRVVLVSADLRKPALERYFNAVDGKQGLATWMLEGLGEPSPCAIPNLYVFSSGPAHANPAELLSSQRFAQLIEWLVPGCDLVLLDSPPALAVADAAVMASHVDATILVLDADSTSPAAAAEAKAKLERVGAKIVGSVLNAFDAASVSPYYQRSYYSPVLPEH